MEKNVLLNHEIVMASSDKATSNFITKMKKEGRIVKIATRIYTTNLNDTPENIIRRNLFFILGELYPDAELTAANQSKIIIPTVFRTDYLSALRQLTRKDNPEKLINAIQRVRMFSNNLRGEDFDDMRNYVERCNAFKEEDDYILLF